MDENQTVVETLKQANGNHGTHMVSPNYNKLSDNIRRLAPHGLQCTMFCGGNNCKYENPDNWTSSMYAIQGIFSNWITDDILAMARPSTSILIKKNVIQQFHSWGIKSVINLQTPKEHASCGSPLEDSGFTYDPSIFMENNIFYYNFAWKDYGDATIQGLLNMVKVLAFAVEEGRVAIHCHAGLGRTGVLIACYLVYILRVKANDAINYVRLKRPGSVQTRGQILCVQQFARYIHPHSIIYNIKDESHKDRRGNELSLSKYIRNQKIILHGYEERALKHIPKVLYCICKRILILCNSWCDEFAIRNIPFTNKFLVTKLNYKDRKNSAISNIYNEISSQRIVCNSAKLHDSSSTCSSINLANDVLYWTENDSYDNITNLKEKNGNDKRHSVSSTSLDCAGMQGCYHLRSCSCATDRKKELLNNVDDEIVNETLSENKCFQLLTELQHESTHEINSAYGMEQIIDALLVDYNSLDESLKKYIKQFEISFNSSETSWSKLKSEKNLVVLTCLLYDWLELLKNPILNREDLSNIVIYNKYPEVCLQKLNVDSQYVLEFILRFLNHLHSINKDTIIILLKRFAASFTHKTVQIKNTRMPSGKDFQRLRDGTLECLQQFLLSLYEIIQNTRTSSAPNSQIVDLYSYKSDNRSEPEAHDDSDVECPNT